MNTGTALGENPDHFWHFDNVHKARSRTVEDWWNILKGTP